MAVQSEDPLKREADKRKDWRGDDAGESPQGGGHSFPASEDEDERSGGGGGEEPRGGFGIVLPPD